MGTDSEEKARGVRRVLLIARISAVLIVALCLLMVVGYSVNPQGSADATTRESFGLALFPFGMSVGYLIALRWQLFGGVLSLVCLGVFLVVMRNVLLVFVIGLVAIPGVLFVIYGLYLRDQQKAPNLD
ncbi:hypothetical protein ACFL3S_08130 [Gemmatimonadota bacterium]